MLVAGYFPRENIHVLHMPKVEVNLYVLTPLYWDIRIKGLNMEKMEKMYCSKNFVEVFNT